MSWSNTFAISLEKGKKFNSSELEDFKNFMREKHPEIKPSGAIGYWMWLDKNGNYLGEAVAKKIDKWECRYYE